MDYVEARHDLAGLRVVGAELYARGLMAMPASIDLCAYAGDTWSQTFRFIEGGEPLDLTDATVGCEARPQGGKSGDQEELYVTVGPDPGEVTLAWQPGTEGLESGAYAYDVEVTTPDGRVTTWVRGRLVVERDVTNAAA
jgi:hypothetical protein